MRSYAGAQRRGIRDEHPDASNVRAHVLSARRAPFFLAQSTPIPPFAGRAVDFSAMACPISVSACWEKQIGHLERLVGEHQGVAASWGACRPTELRPIEPANVLLVGSLMRRFKRGGAEMDRAVDSRSSNYGLLIPGFGLSSQRKSPPPSMGADELFESLSQRFRERARGRDPPLQGKLRSEALQHHGEEWLREPILISDNGSALYEQGEVLNLAFRFSSPHGGPESRLR